jgi:hypothetical protein
MARMYAVTFVAQTLAAASGDIDLWELTPADDKPVEICGIRLSVTSELTDAADEWGILQIIRGHTTSGSGGGTPTPVPINPIDAAAGFTVEDRNTAIASAGTTTIPFADAISVRLGFEVWFPDGFGPIGSQANTTILVRQSTTWADDVTASGTLFVREMP